MRYSVGVQPNHESSTCRDRESLRFRVMLKRLQNPAVSKSEAGTSHRLHPRRRRHEAIRDGGRHDGSPSATRLARTRSESSTSEASQVTAQEYVTRAAADPEWRSS